MAQLDVWSWLYGPPTNNVAHPRCKDFCDGYDDFIDKSKLWKWKVVTSNLRRFRASKPKDNAVSTISMRTEAKVMKWLDVYLQITQNLCVVYFIMQSLEELLKFTKQKGFDHHQEVRSSA